MTSDVTVTDSGPGVCRLEPTVSRERAYAGVGVVRSLPPVALRRANWPLLEGAFLTVEFPNRPNEIAPVTVFGGPLGSFGIAPLEPCPHTFIVTVGQTLGKIVRLLVEARKEGTDRLLVSFGHSTTMARGPSTSKRGRANRNSRRKQRSTRG